MDTYMGSRLHSRQERAVIKSAVIVLFLFLPVLVLGITVEDQLGAFWLLGPAILAVAIVFTMAVRLDRTVWATGTGIGLVATFFWANYLLAPADQELALAGPLGGYVICLLIALIGAATDIVLVSRAKRANRRASAA